MTNTERFNVVSENELTEVIAHFNTEFIMSIVDQAIQNRFSPTAYMANPNVVDAWDMNFKQIVQYYGSVDVEQRIAALREDTFAEICKRICTYHGLSFTIDNVDMYTAAHTLYHFFVSNYLQYLDQFFANYIVQEADTLYQALELDETKGKDASSIYAKKVFKDPRLAIISANIDTVINYISGADIHLEDIINNCGLPPQEAAYLLTIISDANGTFYRDHYLGTIMNDYVKPIRLNSIRFIIRNISGFSDEVLAPMMLQSTDIIDPQF